jgi:hypothetical protein
MFVLVKAFLRIELQIQSIEQTSKPFFNIENCWRRRQKIYFSYFLFSTVMLVFFIFRYLSFVILFSFSFKIIEKERKLNNYIKVSHTSNAMEKQCFCHLLYELISKYCLLKSSSRHAIPWEILQLNFDIAFLTIKNNFSICCLYKVSQINQIKSKFNRIVRR